MELKYIDIHSHLNFKDFDKDLDETIARMKDAGVGTIVVGVDYETSKKAVEIAEANENIWACVGVHPTDSKEGFDEDFFENLVESQKVVVIGECGLDYFHQNDERNKKRQKELFERQIDFAVKHNLPLMLHIRDAVGAERSRSVEDAERSRSAQADALEILKNKKQKYEDKLKGNCHFFTNTWEIAQEYFAIGFTISIPGVATFTNVLDEVLEKSPLENILIETDSPYAAPQGHRGKRNEPAFVPEIVLKISEIKGLSVDVVAKKLLSNTIKTFDLKL